jgi:hypothetical protein
VHTFALYRPCRAHTDRKVAGTGPYSRGRGVGLQVLVVFFLFLVGRKYDRSTRAIQQSDREGLRDPCGTW